MDKTGFQTRQATFPRETPTMYDRQFWNSKLGQAAMASVLSMCAMIALTTQFHVAPDSFAGTTDLIAAVEMA
jgi:type IV secretory pathway TrbF-like protein